jgi:hypothetical protein
MGASAQSQFSGTVTSAFALTAAAWKYRQRMASLGSWGLALLVALGSAVACGNTEHGQPTTQSGGSAGAGGDGLSVAGSSAARKSTGGAGVSGHAGALNAGGTAAGGHSANAGAAGDAEGATAGVTEGGAAGGAEGGTVGESEGGAGGAGMCSQGCTKANAGNFCGQNEVTWLCSPGSTLFQAQCRDAGTNAIRYCCPAAFMANCL